MHKFTYIPTAVLSLSAVVFGASVDLATVSITDAADYVIQPACVQSCVYYFSFSLADYLVGFLGCTSTIYNACYCTPGADQGATKYLTTCIESMCKSTIQISNAISVYENYCTGAGYPRTVSASQTTSTTSQTSSQAPTTSSQTPKTTTSSSSSSPQSSPPTSSPPVTPASSPNTSSTSVATGQSSSSSSSPAPSSSGTTASQEGNTAGKSSGSTSHAGAIAGGVVGGVVGLALVIGAIYFYTRRNRSGAAARTQDTPLPPGGKQELDNQEKENLPKPLSQNNPGIVANPQNQYIPRPHAEELDPNTQYSGGGGVYPNSTELP